MRRAYACAIVALIGVPLACVDLFHSTDFETLGDAATADSTSDALIDAGSKPIVDFCKWSPSEAKSYAARACAWLGACGGVVPENTLGPCMLHALWAYDCDLNPTLRPHGATEALWSCLSDVKSCGEVDACLRPGGGPPDTCIAVASGSFTQCGAPSATELRVECGKPQAGSPTAVQPCALEGKTCVTLNASTSQCAGATRKSCSSGRACTGTGAVDCQLVLDTLVDLGVDCAAFGAGACAQEDAGLGADAGPVACVPSAPAPECDGGIALACDVDASAVARSCVGGREVVVDCAKLGVDCDVTKPTPVPAYAPLRACTKVVDGGGCNSSDECSDGKLRSCAQGMAFEVDCAAVGLGPCERVNNGVLARCTPK